MNAPDAALPQPGDVIADRYRIDELLGRGGMGAVFRATQLGLLRAVAVKVLLPERTGHRVRERFEREARVTAAMRHDGVVDVYDFGVDEQGRLFLVMELLLGESLRQRLDRVGTMSVDDATAVVRQVAAALASAHEVGLVHRDIKPDNVFCVEGEGKAGGGFKLVDFGLAFIKDGGELGRLTSDTIISGTPDYMSPEQCRGGAEVGPRADIYALGCVLMEMLTGDPPFQGQQGELLAQQLHVPAPRLSSRRSDAPPHLTELVDQMLHKRPDSRPTAVEVLAALSEHAETTASSETKARDRSGRALAPHLGVPSPQAPTADVATTDIVVTRPLITVRGEALPGLAIALAVNGFDVEERPLVDDDAPADGVELALSATPAQVARRVAAGAVVVAAADPDDIDTLTAFVRAGAAEVTALPINLEDLAARVVRAQRRVDRKKRS